MHKKAGEAPKQTIDFEDGSCWRFLDLDETLRRPGLLIWKISTKRVSAVWTKPETLEEEKY